MKETEGAIVEHYEEEKEEEIPIIPDKLKEFVSKYGLEAKTLEEIINE